MTKIDTKKTFKELTTFQIGGQIKYFAEVKNKKELCEICSFAKEKKLPIFILGGGSDILVSDRNFNGVVIKYTEDKLKVKSQKSKVLLTAEAGMIWDNLVDYAVRNGLQGIECLSGIPGTVGAAPVQNIGAYGQELKDAFEKLTALDIKKQKFVEFNKKDCQFSYRESVFKKKENWQRYVIINVVLKLEVNKNPEVKYDSLKKYLAGRNIKNPTLKDVRKAVIAIRSNIFYDPKKVGNAGSFFKSPIVNKNKLETLLKKYPDLKFYETGNEFKLPAGWLIEKAGWRGKEYKNAGVSPKHALILTNRGGKAQAKDIFELSKKISRDVEKKFGLVLEKEVQLINF